MTVKEFSKKYELEYSIVYNATYLIKRKPQFPFYSKDYDENELKTAVRVMLANRMDRHRREFKKAAGLLKKVSI